VDEPTRTPQERAADRADIVLRRTRRRLLYAGIVGAAVAVGVIAVLVV
jgi:hypothetical protein